MHCIIIYDIILINISNLPYFGNIRFGKSIN